MSIDFQKIKAWWDNIQSLLDLDGDIYMGAFTATIILRLLLVHWGWPHLTNAEAAAYTGAIGSFAYSNRGQK